VIADSASEFSDDVLERNAADPYEYAGDAARRLPGDMVRGFSNAIDHGLDAPRRAVERFDRTYRDEPRRRPRRRAGGRDAFESVDDPIQDWSTSALRAEARSRRVDNSDTLSREALLSALSSPASEASPRRAARSSATGSDPTTPDAKPTST
jgi:hypothetical protein